MAEIHINANMASQLQYIKPYNLQRVSGSITEILSLSVVKNYLRVSFNDDDALIAELIVAARHFAENYTGNALVAQNFEVSYLGELPNFIALPMSPIGSITSIITEDLSGNQVNLPTNAYHLSSGRYLHLHQYICAHITKIAYQTLSTIGEQAAIKRAMLSHIAIMYDMRGDAPIPSDAINIYQQYKQVRV
jgi:uncharacterized phiE125 gp8 family phage protein